MLDARVVPAVPIWRLSVAQYHAMIQAGILVDDDPVELLEGLMVTRVPKNRPYSIATLRTRKVLEGAVPQGWYVDSQEPITTGDSEPEPDVIVVRGTEADYPDGQPTASAVALVVEISDTTLQRDCTLSQRVYARAGIPVYWLLNLADRQLEVYTDPAPEAGRAAYRQRQTCAADAVVPLVVDGAVVGEVKIANLLP